MRNPEALEATMEQLSALAWAAGRDMIPRVSSQRAAARLCERHGPGLLGLLDDFYAEKMSAARCGRGAT